MGGEELDQLLIGVNGVARRRERIEYKISVSYLAYGQYLDFQAYSRIISSLSNIEETPQHRMCSLDV